MATYSANVSSKGQLVIPLPLREQFQIEPGTRVVFRVSNGMLALEVDSVAAKLEKIERMRGVTAGYGSGTDLLLEDRRIERERELREEGW